MTSESFGDAKAIFIAASEIDSAEARETGVVAVCHAHLRRFGRKSGHVRADEACGASDADRHNFRLGNLFRRSYTRVPNLTQCRYASSP